MSKKYAGYIAFFKYRLNEEQMTQVRDALLALKLVDTVDPIEAVSLSARIPEIDDVIPDTVENF